MYGLVGRNAVVVGATVAAVLLVVQLSANGVRAYAFSDILSVLLVIAPMAARSARPVPRRRAARRADDAADRPAGGGTDDHRSAPRAGDPEGATVIERMLARGLATVVAVGAWLLAVVLVLLQAWPPALSALIVFAAAAAGLPADTDEAPVASAPGNSPG